MVVIFIQYSVGVDFDIFSAAKVEFIEVRIQIIVKILSNLLAGISDEYNVNKNRNRCIMNAGIRTKDLRAPATPSIVAEAIKRLKASGTDSDKSGVSFTIWANYFVFSSIAF